MAFRPYVQADLGRALDLLTDVAGHSDFAKRRFAVEVTRPRSVWGEHIRRLKQEPELAAGLLQKVQSDPAKYVQLAVGNWVNDASKSRPDWALQICAEWMQSSDPSTRKIVRRGLRTLRSQRQTRAHSGELFPMEWPAALDVN